VGWVVGNSGEARGSLERGGAGGDGQRRDAQQPALGGGGPGEGQGPPCMSALMSAALLCSAAPGFMITPSISTTVIVRASIHQKGGSFQGRAGVPGVAPQTSGKGRGRAGRSRACKPFDARVQQGCRRESGIWEYSQRFRSSFQLERLAAIRAAIGCRGEIGNWRAALKRCERSAEWGSAVVRRWQTSPCMAGWISSDSG